MTQFERIISAVSEKNKTTVGVGSAAGVIATILWGVVSAVTGYSPTPELVASSVVVVTSAVQFFTKRK